MMKHATMELGGKSPLIVFDDADIENAVGGAMLGNFYSTGQVCSNGTRVFVQKGIHDRFVDRLTERTKKIRIGDPLDPGNADGAADQQGAAREGAGLYRDRQGGRRDARTTAAACRRCRVSKAASSSSRPSSPASPTAMRIAREEIFGPVMSVLSFDGEDEAIARANDTEFGLSAGVFTRDLPRAHRVDRRAAGRHLLDQRLQSDAGRDPVRRLQAVRHRPRELAGRARATIRS